MGTIAAAIRTRRIFYGWWIVLVAFIGFTVSAGASAWAFSVLVKPMSQEMGWTRSEIFSVVTLSSIVSGVASPIIGRLVDRYGARGVIVVCAIIAGMGLVLVSQIQPSSAKIVALPLSLFFFMLFFGVMKGMSAPGLSMVGPGAVIANWFVRRRGRAYALLSTGSPVSGMIFPPFVTWVMAISGWRAAWVIMGAIPLLVLAPMAWAVVRRRPEDLGLKPDGGEESPNAPERNEKARPQRLRPEEEFTAKEALKTRTFWIFTFGFALAGMPGGTIFLHMPSYYTDNGLSAATAAGLMSVYAFGALLARGIWGILAERFPIKVLLVAHALNYSAGIALFLTVGVQSLWLLYPTVVFLGIGAGGSMQLDSQAWADFYGRREIGSIMGLWTLFRTGLSSGGPLFAAIMFDIFKGYTIPFGLFSLLLLVAAGILVFANPPRKPALVPVAT